MEFTGRSRVHCSDWPVGIGFKGNGGVRRRPRTTNGSIGYVELSYALRLYLPYAEVQTRAGQYVAPTIGGALAAAASFEHDPR